MNKRKGITVRDVVALDLNTKTIVIRNDSLGFMDAVVETAKRLGPPPLIGTFEPNTGDIGRDPDNRHYVWNGTCWVDSKGVRHDKEYSDKWMGFTL